MAYFTHIFLINTVFTVQSNLAIASAIADSNFKGTVKSLQVLLLCNTFTSKELELPNFKTELIHPTENTDKPYTWTHSKSPIIVYKKLPGKQVRSNSL